MCLMLDYMFSNLALILSMVHNNFKDIIKMSILISILFNIFSLSGFRDS